MKKIIIIFAFITFSVTKNNAQTVTDYDGNIYNTVTIGTQVWLKEDLKVTHYRSGVPIPNVKSDTLWGELSTGAYCDIDNKVSNSSTYGRLYNWYAVIDSNNLAPIGWHIPSNLEWIKLTDFLGGKSVAGGKLKETGNIHWSLPNIGATNESGFTALPGGARDMFESFSGIGAGADWWSSTEETFATAFIWGMYYNAIFILNSGGSKRNGYFIRCLKDSATQINDLNHENGIKIYPNPAIDKVYINSSDRQVLKMQLFNTIGECVMQKELNNLTNSIDISSLTKGIYILTIITPNGTIEKKILKE